MISEDLLQFISGCVSPFHVAEAVSELLSRHGFRPLSETDSWTLEPGESYYVTRNGSSIIAFRVGGSVPADGLRFQMAAGVDYDANDGNDGNDTIF